MLLASSLITVYFRTSSSQAYSIQTIFGREEKMPNFSHFLQSSKLTSDLILLFQLRGGATTDQSLSPG